MIKSSNKTFLVDCGDGAQYPLLRHTGNLGQIFRILISHEHFDHMSGLGGLIYTLDLRGVPNSLEIYAGHSALIKIGSLLQLLDIGRGLKVELIPIRSGIIWKDEHIKCIAFATNHTKCSYGFIFEENEQRHFLPEKAIELGVPRGKIRKQLISGKAVILPSGDRIEPDMVLSDTIRGKKVVFITDAAYHPKLIDFCRGANCLVAEATYLESDSELAKTYKHFTAKRAGILAREAAVESLYLNHISTRYSDKEILDEVSKEFSNVFLSQDLQIINI